MKKIKLKGIMTDIMLEDGSPEHIGIKITSPHTLREIDFMGEIFQGKGYVEITIKRHESKN